MFGTSTKGSFLCSSLHACPFSTLWVDILLIYAPLLAEWVHTHYLPVLYLHWPTLYYSRRGKWNLAVPSHSSANLWRINKPLPHVEDKLVIDLHWNHFVEPALLHGRPRIVERRFSNKDSEPFGEPPVVKKSSKPFPVVNATKGVRETISR